MYPNYKSKRVFKEEIIDVLSSKNKQRFYELINKQKDGDMVKNNIMIYMSKDGNVQVDVNILGDDIWMSQDVMANLYDTTKNNISMHLKNIFDEGELEKDSVVKKFLTTASDGKKYNVLHYNQSVDKLPILKNEKF